MRAIGGTGDGSSDEGGDGSGTQNEGAGDGSNEGGDGSDAQNEGIVDSNNPAAGRPFILLNALLALAAVALALMTFLSKNYSGKWKAVSIATALIAVILFLMNIGWQGIRFADSSTIFVAIFAAATAAASYTAPEQSEEEEP